VLTIFNSERDRELSYRFGQDYGLTAMSFLALVLWPLGEVDRSRLLAEDAVTRALQDGHVPTLYLVRNVITASLEMIRGDGRRAIPHLEASLSLAREHGMQLPLLTSTFGLAWARWHAGLGEAGAAVEMRERRGLIRSSHYRFLEPLYAKLLADVEAGTGQAERALDTVDNALFDADETGQKWYDAELHRVRGELLLERSPADAAAVEATFVRAIELARNQQTRSFELRAALSLARFYQKTGRGADASEWLIPALLDFREGLELPEVAEAGRLLASIQEKSGTAA
jgi:predicted ATPase